MKIRYTPEAIGDLERLESFISAKNPAAAQRIAKELLAGIEKLKVFPKMGLAVARAPDPSMIRDLFVGDYTVRYFINDDVIFVLRVWHGKEIEKDL